MPGTNIGLKVLGSNRNLCKVFSFPAASDENQGGTGKPPVSDDDIVPPGAAKLTLLHNSLLVPEKYDRDIRHYEFKWLGEIRQTLVDWRRFVNGNGSNM